ncbi:hypothetical protein GGQ60_000749 [Pedobacter zeae]|uniref:Uncharacterized protein n=1 Tax=Pedobacter zeae TaxID=1737356 RepID=A0A7W6P3T3_9SPHI|nr:hypothetical protein [Pedobacter zeae]
MNLYFLKQPTLFLSLIAVKSPESRFYIGRGLATESRTAGRHSALNANFQTKKTLHISANQQKNLGKINAC